MPDRGEAADAPEGFENAPRAVLFDKDGTLLDFEATWGPATREVTEALAAGDPALAADLAALCGLDPATERFDPASPFIGGYTDDFAPQWAARLGVPYDRAFVDRADALFRRASLQHLVAFDDTAATIAALAAAGMPVGLATNDFAETGRLHLERMGILPAFRFVAGYDSGFGPKPGPGMVLAFAETVGVVPADVLLVGDSAHDAAAARAAGARFLGLRRSALAAASLDGLAVPTVARLAELLPRLGLALVRS